MSTDKLEQLKNYYSSLESKPSYLKFLKGFVIKDISLGNTIFNKRKGINLLVRSPKKIFSDKFVIILLSKYSCPFNIEIFYHSIDYSIKLPVGAFAKIGITEIKQLDIPLKTEHFFLLSSLCIENFQIFFNRVTNLVVAIIIDGKIEYNKYGMLTFPNGISLKGEQTVSVFINTCKDNLTPNEIWKEGITIYNGRKKILPA